MRIRRDGSIQSSSIPVSYNLATREDFGLYRAVVVARYFTDHALNITEKGQTPRVLYDVVLIGGARSGQLITNCRFSSSLGSVHNYHERVLRPSSKPVAETGLTRTDGDIVLLQFMQGDPSFPMIVGCDQGNKSDLIGATEEDGPRFVWEYNGVNVNVDKLGELTILKKGGTYDAGKQVFTPNNGANQFEFKLQSNVVTITLDNGATLTMDGESDNIFLQTKAGAKLNLNQDKVALGSSEELLDLVSQLAQVVSDIALANSTETHPTAVGPSGPPINSGDYTTAKSTVDQIKSKVDSIKGVL